MRVNFNRFFVDQKGNPLSVVMADEIGKSLFFLGSSGKTQFSAEEKYRAYKLCNRISSADGEIELTAEEAAYILRICGEALSAGAYGQIRDIIEHNQ